MSIIHSWFILDFVLRHLCLKWPSSAVVQKYRARGNFWVPARSVTENCKGSQKICMKTNNLQSSYWRCPFSNGSQNVPLHWYTEVKITVHLSWLQLELKRFNISKNEINVSHAGHSVTDSCWKCDFIFCSSTYPTLKKDECYSPIMQMFWGLIS